MCRATLLPDPESPLMMIRCIALAAAALSGSAQPHGFFDVMVGGFLLVLLHAAVELVGERVDGGIHVPLGRIGVDLVATQGHRCLGDVAQLLYAEHAVYVDESLEMPGQAFEFLRDVAAQCGSDFQTMTAEF